VRAVDSNQGLVPDWRRGTLATVTLATDGLLERARLVNLLGRWSRGLSRARVVLAVPLAALLLAMAEPQAVAAPPGNDNFADAAVLAGPGVSIAADNREATVEPGEPNHVGEFGLPRRTLWWSWTASATGSVTFEAPYDMGVAVYTGEALGGLTTIASGRSISFIPYEPTRVSFRAVAGQSYRIVASEGAYFDYLGREFTLDFKAAPANDDFSNAATLSGPLTINTTGSTALASAEPGEPAHGGFAAVHSVWWKWTAASSGPVAVEFCGTSGSSAVAVYTGSSVAALTRVDYAGGFCGLAFQATAGVTYLVAVDGSPGGSVSLALKPSPANDDFENAAPLGPPPSVVERSNLAAGKQAGEPNHAGNAGGRSLWWTWTPSADMRVTVETCGSPIDTLLAVYTGETLSALTPVAESDALCGNDGSVTFRALAGQTYRIAVDGRDGAMGPITLSTGIPPANDAFVDASLLGGFPATASGTNVLAGIEPGEPAHGAVPGGRSVWWRWTAPVTRGVVVNSCSSGFFNMVSVYSGGAVDALEPVGSHQGNCRVAFRASQGSTYRIAVDGVSAQSGPVALAIDPSPANDDFAEAATLSGPPGSASAGNLGATKESGEPAHAGDPGGTSLWWRWTPAASGPVRIDSCASSLDTLLAVYTGVSVSALTPVAHDNNSCGYAGGSLVRFTAEAGTTYRIAVDGAGGTTGSIQLTLAAGAVNDAFASPTQLTGSFASVLNQANYDATKELGEPYHAGNPGAHSLWYSWTAPAAGDTTVDTCDSTFDTVLAVYRGEALGSLTPVTSDDDGCVAAEGSFAEFTAEPGVTYRIAVDGYYGATGSFDLYVELTPSPECSDGQDNDGDGKLDAGDPGCAGPSDDDETDPPPPSPPPTAPPPPPPPPPDTTAPELELTGRATQSVRRQRGILVTAACAVEACTVTAKGNVSLRGAAKVLRFIPVTKQIANGARTALKLKLKWSALTTIARALRSGQKLSANVTVTAKDAAGNVTTSRRTIRLKP
jgi:hypothetical protein